MAASKMMQNPSVVPGNGTAEHQFFLSMLGGERYLIPEAVHMREKK